MSTNNQNDDDDHQTTTDRIHPTNQTHQTQPRFAMDISLFRFAKQLRLLGCDVLCSSEFKQQSLVDIAEKEQRIMVTSVGKNIPLLFRYTIIGDLTFGKAFENIKTVSVSRNGKTVVQVQKKRNRKGQHAGDESSEEDENQHDSNGKNRTEKEAAEHSGEDDDTNYFGAAAILEAPSDPRKFHWIEEEDPSTKKMKRRRRRLVGYNSDGESDYEYEEAKKTEMKLQEEEQVAAEQRSTEQKNKKKLNEDANNNQSASSTSQSSPVIVTEQQKHQAALLQRLTELVKTATPGSTAAVAANACNCALLRGQKNFQNSSLQYIVVDIHSSFKQMLSAIILIAGVSWIPSMLFTRCVKCNEKILPVEKEKVKDIVQPAIYRIYAHFYQCPSCLCCFWGVDSGIVVNFKSARTTEYLRSLFEEDVNAVPLEMDERGNSGMENDSENNSSSSTDNFDSLGRKLLRQQVSPPSRTSRESARWGFMPRHIFSFPRRVKLVIFEFMSFAELDRLVAACPMFRELVDKVKNGEDLKFVPEMRKKKLQSK